tara:strand:+ start:191 stop:532 length:342 start_codon:yes stop_codon:yes gene_type:complete
MKSQISSLKKQKDFKSIIKGKKINNKYLTIFFRKLSDKSNKNLNISFVAKKKLGNAVKRNRTKRRLRNIMTQILKISKINLNYSYLLIAKQNIIDAKFSEIKEVVFKDYKKIK